MYRGLPPRRRLERALSSGARRKLHRRSAAAAAAATTTTTATTTTQAASRGRALGQSARAAGSASGGPALPAGQAGGRARGRRVAQQRDQRQGACQGAGQGAHASQGSQGLQGAQAQAQGAQGAQGLLPLWRPTPKDDLAALANRSDLNNVLLALGLKPANKRVAERFFRTALAGNDRMHGIMEGPGEELTVAAVASDGLDDGHLHHHHHNGVSASPIHNGASPPPKDARPPESPPSPPPTSPQGQNGANEDVTKQDPLPQISSINDAKEKDALPEGSSASDVENNEKCSTGENVEESTDSGEPAEKIKLEEEPTITVPVADDKEESKVESGTESGTETSEKTETDNKTDTENSGTEGCADVVDKEDISDKDVDSKEEPVAKDPEPELKEETECDGSPDVKETACVESPKAEEADDVAKALSVDETPVIAETSPVTVENADKDGDQEKMVTETSIIPSEEISVPNEEDVVDETLEDRPSSATQKRSSSEDSDSNQTVKKCRPNETDTNALDLSSIRKSDSPLNEAKIAVKPQSLLLSKLQSGTDKNKNDSHQHDDNSSNSKKHSESVKITKSISSSRADRRRSRDEKDRTYSQRRSSESSTLRSAGRDQALREMRDRVLSSYKEQRASKDECLLRDLLEPERDALLSELVEAATMNGGVSELDRVCNLLNADIRQLNSQITTKEMEWNELLRKRKLKEELCIRIERRKQVLLLTGDYEEDRGRSNSFEEDARSEPRRESRLEARLEGRHDIRREVPNKSGEELLATALRLGSRNIEDYHHPGNGSSSSLAVRIQARANELLAGTTPPLERKSSGPLPGLSQMQPQSLLQSQLSQPSEHSSSSSQSQFLLQHLQRQRVLMNASSSVGSACRLSPSVSLSAIPTSTSTTSALNPSLSSTTSPCNKVPIPPLHTGKQQLRTQRPILPKPSSATSGGHVVSDASLDASGAGVIGEGRQGPILDVKSIIADYRSKHPEGVPRRGRRLKPNSLVPENLVAGARPGSSSGGGLLSMSLPALGSGSHVRTGGASLHNTVPVDLSELGFVLTSGAGSDGPSRPSSTESSLSGAPSQINQDTGMSFKDVLVQFAKMTNAGDQNNMNNSSAMLSRPPPPPYPEVTLHPVVTPMSSASPTPATSSPTTSLLHGILTKSTSQSNNGSSQSHAKPATFSPTLARLLTAPERSSTSAVGSGSGSLAPNYPPAAAGINYPPLGGSGPVLLSDLLSGASANKARSELTITPVTGTSNQCQTSVQVTSRAKQEVVVLDGEDAMDVNGDEADGDTDSDERRLVIDEGDNGEHIEGGDSEMNGEPPKRAAIPHCQGCNERDAEFVCAGCQNQWYCSRECQIASWDEHSEMCFPPNPS